MRPRPSWWGTYDEAILEWFEDSGVAAPPAVVQFNLNWSDIADPSKSTIRRRVRKLEQEGLLTKVDETAGYYAISEFGKAYLCGDLDAEDLEPEG